MKNVSLKYMKWLLPILFAAYYSFISLCVHVHIEDGTAIVHAHPFKKTADGSCHHHASLSEILLFHQLTTIQAEDGAVEALQMSVFVFLFREITETLICPGFFSDICGKSLLRAPPFFA